MKVFVLSFGTIELLDGILVVDADLSFKTFEKEYSEILRKSDKSLKKILKNAFEKGEYETDPEAQEGILDILRKLEAYDSPSFDFGETLDEKGDIELPEPTEPEKSAAIEEEEPEILEEPEIFAEPEVPEPIESPVDSNPEPELGAADLQDALTSMRVEDELETPAIAEVPIEEEPISDIEVKSRGVISDFIVQLTENAEFQLNHDQKVEEATVSGKITLNNLGQNDRIWDINIQLDKSKIKGTSLKENLFHINELGPGQSWDKEYTVKKLKDVPIVFKEHIDTFVENTEETHTLIANQETLVKFEFSLTNPHNYEMTNLKMKKEIPEEFVDMRLLDAVPPKTEINFENQVLLWKISTLHPNQTVTLKIQGNVTLSTLESIKTGPIQIDFTLINNLYSDLVLEDISSISKNMYYIEKDEEEQTPNNWHCRFIFENKSEFPILLESAEIFSGDISSDQKEVVLRAINAIIQPTDEEWQSQDWTVFNEEIPTFGKSVKFKIIPSTTKSLSVNLSLEEIELPSLWVEAEKTYSIQTVASFVETPLDVTISLLNQGTAEINELTIQDFIPENFTPPSPDQIKLLLNGKVLDKTNQKINLTIERKPDSDDPAEPHQLHIQLTDLRNSISSIKKDDKFELEYSLQAVKPPPGKEYNFPIKITANTHPLGPPLVLSPDTVKNSDIKVEHRRRKLTVGKSVFPGAEPGEYEILIVFKNRGNAPVENIMISDLIPTNFELLKSEPEPSTSAIEAKTLLEWTFPKIAAGKKLEISYSLKGTGDYKGSDAQAFYKV